MTFVAIAVLIIGYTIGGLISVGLGEAAAFDAGLSGPERIFFFLMWPIPFAIYVAIVFWPLVLTVFIAAMGWSVYYLLF